jgi:hypothetical protein
MSIMDKLFGSAPAQTAAPGTGNPGNIPQGAGTQPATGSGVVPAGAANEPTKPESPLDGFSDLWQPPAKPEGAAGESANFFNVDPAKLMESAKRVDFSKAITPEQLAAIQQGGESATKAFAEAMNSVAQQTFAQSAMATTKIVEAALAKAEASYDAKIPGMLKKQQVNENLRQDNPIFNHPATAPILSAIEHQLTLKNPTASAAEITNMARDYMTQFGAALVPKPEPAKPAKGEIDWNSFLN